MLLTMTIIPAPVATKSSWKVDITNLTTAIQVGNITTTQAGYTPTTGDITLQADTSALYDQSIINNIGTAGWTIINTDNAFAEALILMRLS